MQLARRSQCRQTPSIRPLPPLPPLVTSCRCPTPFAVTSRTRRSIFEGGRDDCRLWLLPPRCGPRVGYPEAEGIHRYSDQTWARFHTTLGVSSQSTRARYHGEGGHTRATNTPSISAWRTNLWRGISTEVAPDHT